MVADQGLCLIDERRHPFFIPTTADHRIRAVHESEVQVAVGFLLDRRHLVDPHADRPVAVPDVVGEGSVGDAGGNRPRFLPQLRKTSPNSWLLFPRSRGQTT